MTASEEQIEPSLRAKESAVKVGIALNMLTKEGLSDAVVLGEHMALGDLAEPLGFDSLWALEHHFTGYAMSPAPLQTLSYYAGRTKRIALGTAVIVLPWHDPVRVAEQIALLDIFCGGRCLFDFGRGAASVGSRVPHPDGGGAPALRGGGADRGQGAVGRLVRVAGRVLQHPAHVDPAPARSPTRSAASTPPR